jgi:hypothetical protein
MGWGDCKSVHSPEGHCLSFLHDQVHRNRFVQFISLAVSLTRRAAIFDDVHNWLARFVLLWSGPMRQASLRKLHRPVHEKWPLKSNYCLTVLHCNVRGSFVIGAAVSKVTRTGTCVPSSEERDHVSRIQFSCSDRRWRNKAEPVYCLYHVKSVNPPAFRVLASFRPYIPVNQQVWSKFKDRCSPHVCDTMH